MNELTNTVKARDLDRRIKVSAQLAQQSLYDMCVAIKEMRDSKLYKELGYGNFEDYCEQEIGIKHSQAYRFIAVAEKFNENSFPSMGKIGMTKLALLAELDEPARAEIAGNTDLEAVTVRELKEKIKALETQADKVPGLEKQIKELESRPIEVAVQSSADEERLRETIRALERENIRQNEEMDRANRRQIADLYQRVEREKQEEIARIKAELEQNAPTPAQDKEKQDFKALLTNAADSIRRLTDFVRAHDKELYRQKLDQLAAMIREG